METLTTPEHAANPGVPPSECLEIGTPPCVKQTYVGPFWFWLRYSKGSQAAALNEARRLLCDAWAAGRKDRLQNHTDNLALPHEVRMFACDIASEAHLKAARNLPSVVVQIGRFAITVSRPNAGTQP